MPTKVGDIFVRANLDDKQYRRGLSNLDKFSSGIAKSIGRKLTFAGAIAGLGMFAKKATEAGASLNAMGTIIDASLPHMTKQVDDFAKSAGAMFGLSETQAKGFVGKFASMASAMGYTEKQAYQMSTALTGLAGDVASYYHITADDAYAKLGAVFTGETEALKQLGVVMTQNALDQFALQQGFGKTTAKMTELEKTTLRYQFVMDRLKLANGDFAKYANTWSGSLATLRLNWSNFMATVGQGLINILLPLLQAIAKLSNALTVLGSKFLAWTQKIRGIKTDSKQTAQAMSTTAESASDLGDGFDKTSTTAKKAKKEVQKLKRELLGFDKIIKLTKQDTDTGTSGDTGISGVSAPITASGVDFSQADGDVKNFAERATDYLSKIKLPPSLTKALDGLSDAFGALFDTIGKAGSWAYENVLKPLGKWTMNKLLPAQLNALSSSLKVINSLLGFLGELLKPLWDYVLKPLFSVIGDLWVSKLNNFSNAMQWMSRVLDDATRGLKIFKENSGNVKVVLQDKFSSVWNKIKSAWSGLKNKSATFTLKLKDLFTSAWNKIKNIWNGITDRVATFTTNYNTNYTTTYTTTGISGSTSGSTTKGKEVKTGKNNKKKAGGGVFVNGHWRPIQSYATGGTPGQGQLFVAREAGAELVGRIGGHTAVMNNDQIVASVSNGVAKAMSRLRVNLAPQVVNRSTRQAQMQTQEVDLREVTQLLTRLLTAVNALDLDVTLDGESIKNNTVRRINNHTRATGQLELIV